MAYLSEAAASVPVRAASVAANIESFDAVLERLEIIAHRATKCGDQITGSRPNAVEANEKSPTPGHLLVAIEVRRNRLVRAVDHIESEIQRIESGLG